jgi:uncharacterized YigZ family protein
MDAIYSYYTIQSPGEGAYKEKGSKFLSFAFPVASEDEVKEKLRTLKIEYYDARHHCFAWMLGPDKKQFRAYDDGEPNHSAGDPILGQIRSRNLTNVLVVVVRYFGGTKLGVSGLIAAYKTAAEDALDNSLVIEKQVMERVTLSYDYSVTTEVMRMVKDFDLTILDQEFVDNGKLVAELPLKLWDKFEEKIKLLIALGLPVSYTN